MNEYTHVHICMEIHILYRYSVNACTQIVCANTYIYIYIFTLKYMYTYMYMSESHFCPPGTTVGE